MKNYTIIALDENSGESVRYVIHAATPYEAMALAAARAAEPSAFVILGAIEGAHTLIRPGDDNNASVYASDLLDCEAAHG